VTCPLPNVRSDSASTLVIKMILQQRSINTRTIAVPIRSSEKEGENGGEKKIRDVPIKWQMYKLKEVHAHYSKHFLRIHKISISLLNDLL